MESTKPSAARGIKKILIVEDEAIIGMSLAAELEDLGYEVVGIAGDGEEAISLMQDEQVDLVLLDIKLSGNMDGIEILAEIRLFADPLVIIISGNSEAKSLKRVREKQVDGFLVKPVQVSELEQMIETIQKQGG